MQQHQNPMLLAKNSCIFCLDDDLPEQLVNNTNCSCKFNCHKSCLQTWNEKQQQQNKQPTCLMCHKPLPSAPIHNIVPEIVIHQATIILEERREQNRIFTKKFAIGAVIALILAIILILFRFWI